MLASQAAYIKDLEQKPDATFYEEALARLKIEVQQKGSAIQNLEQQLDQVTSERDRVTDECQFVSHELEQYRATDLEGKKDEIQTLQLQSSLDLLQTQVNRATESLQEILQTEELPID